MPESEIPIYLNWSFWAVIVSIIALTLSQIPPIKELLKKAKLELEVYSKVSISHKVGNPNLQLHIILSNNGGRSARITGITTSISRDGSDIAYLPAQNYLQNQNDKDSLLFTPFSLKPNNEWGHIINFLKFFSRDDEKTYRKIEGAMITNYHKQRDELGPKKDNTELIEHPEHLTKEAISFYDTNNIWSSGEYTININVSTKDNIANTSKIYRFTIFETDEEQLKAITQRYKFGEGIWWDSTPVRSNILLPISEA